jgi:hypothetical protein
MQIKTGTEKPGFYAIASAPKGNGRFEFLVKENEFNKWLTEVRYCLLGSAVTMSIATTTTIAAAAVSRSITKHHPAPSCSSITRNAATCQLKQPFR